jgi:hypothetical protein
MGQIFFQLLHNHWIAQIYTTRRNNIDLLPGICTSVYCNMVDEK